MTPACTRWEKSGADIASAAPRANRWAVSCSESLDDEQADYVRFHLEVVACRLCHANLEDLRQRQAESDEMHRRETQEVL